MTFTKTLIVCGLSIVCYDYFKNHPDNYYVKLTHVHINKSIEICPFLSRIFNK